MPQRLEAPLAEAQKEFNCSLRKELCTLRSQDLKMAQKEAEKCQRTNLPGSFDFMWDDLIRWTRDESPLAVEG